MNPILNPAAGVDWTFAYIFGIAFVLLFGITATMIVFVIRYRRSRNPVAADIRGHTGLEIAWMLIPLAIALSMFYFGWESYLGLRNVPANALQIDVMGEEFAWTFTYPNGKEMVNELVVPLGQPVKLNISSRDVIHSLFIPAFRIKMDALRGMKTYTWFLPDRPGTFTILCAEYCGTGHSDMNADLKILPKADFETWLATPAPEKVAASAVSEDVRQRFATETFHSVTDSMTFSWCVNGTNLDVKLKAPTTGWLAIGFNPVRVMKGANYIFAYVKNGKVYVSDHFGTGLVAHDEDVKLGGHNDIQNAFGTEKDGTTEVAFTIPLDSGDPYDVVLDPQGQTTVLLAYNAGLDNTYSKHNFRKAFVGCLATGEFKPRR